MENEITSEESAQKLYFPKTKKCTPYRAYIPVKSTNRTIQDNWTVNCELQKKKKKMKRNSYFI